MQSSMRVLHLPMNIASQISTTVRALRDIGVDAQGMVIDNSIIQGNEGIRNFETISLRRHPLRGAIRRLLIIYEFQTAIRWADVIHWHFNASVLPKDLDLKYINFLNKPRIVEFWGSDVRIPEIASADNPYIAKLYREYPELTSGARDRSIQTQMRFSRYGFECLLPGAEIYPYINESIFPTPYKIKARLIISDFIPKYPDPAKKRPVIAHAPSHKGKKGTNAVLWAIDHLKKRYDFEFRVIHGVNHAEAINIISNCDVMVDQFVAGAHGLASLEAMALGKPTLCYIKPSLVETFPPDFPIVNANQDNLSEVLGKLLENGALRHQIGRQSRAYVEKYHDAHKMAHDLVKIYEELIKKNNKKKA